MSGPLLVSKVLTAHIETPYQYHPHPIMASATMKAVNYVGPFQVKVEEVEMPSLLHPDDVIVKVTTVSLSFELQEAHHAQFHG